MKANGRGDVVGGSATVRKNAIPLKVDRPVWQGEFETDDIIVCHGSGLIEYHPDDSFSVIDDSQFSGQIFDPNFVRAGGGVIGATQIGLPARVYWVTTNQVPATPTVRAHTDYPDQLVCAVSPEGVAAMVTYSLGQGITLYRDGALIGSISTTPLGDDAINGKRVRVRGNVVFWEDTTGPHFVALDTLQPLPFVARPDQTDVDEMCPVTLTDGSVGVVERADTVGLTFRNIQDGTTGSILVNPGGAIVGPDARILPDGRIVVAYATDQGEQQQFSYIGDVAGLGPITFKVYVPPPTVLPDIPQFTTPVFVGFSWVPTGAVAPGSCQILTEMAGEPTQDWRAMADPNRPVFAGSECIAVSRPTNLLGQIGSCEGGWASFGMANLTAWIQSCANNNARPAFSDDGEGTAYPADILAALPSGSLPIVEAYPLNGETPAATIARCDAKMEGVRVGWSGQYGIVIPFYTQQGNWDKACVLAIHQRVGTWVTNSAGRLVVIWCFPWNRDGVGGPNLDPDMRIMGTKICAAAPGIPTLNPYPVVIPPPPAPTPQPPKNVLGSGSQLNCSESLVSPSGGVTLVLQDEGNLVLYGANGSVLWASPMGGQSLVMQGDGNLVLYGANQNIVWVESGNLMTPGSYLEVIDSGVFQIVAPSGAIQWSSLSLTTAPVSAPKPISTPPPTPVPVKSTGINPIVYVVIAIIGALILWAACS